MISGTYQGFKGYYNYYNIGASGTTDAEVLKNGLTYAKNKGWNTRFKSLDGGAAFIGNGYILKGQDTLYLQKFDVESSGVLHQYMQNIMAPYTEGRSMQTMYAKAGSLNSSFVFKIPVFLNMPKAYTISSDTLKLKKGNFTELKVKDGEEEIQSTKIAFKSQNESVAKVSATGIVTAVGNGKTTISAVINGVELTCEVVVYDYVITPEKVTLNKGSTFNNLKIMERSYQDTNIDSQKVQVIFQSDNEEIAKVSEKGVVTAVGGGTTTIRATVKEKENNNETKLTCEVSVYNITPPNLKIKKGNDSEALKVQCGDKEIASSEITFQSQNEKVAKVSATGVVTAVGNGKTTVSAVIKSNGAKLTCEVVVYDYVMTPTILELKKGDSFDNLKIMERINQDITIDSEKVQVIFQSDNEQIAKVSEKGVVTAVGGGTTTIRAIVTEKSQESGGKNKTELTCEVEVYTPLESISLNHKNAELFLIEGTPEQIPVSASLL